MFDLRGLDSRWESPRRSSAAWLVVAVLAATVRPVWAQDAAEAQKVLPGESVDRAAERINEEGKKLVAAGKYEEALDKFRISLSLFPLSNAIFNVGSMLYTLRHYDEAHPYLEQTLRAPLDPRQREIVLNHLENVSHQLKNSHHPILVETNPPGATVAINGKDLPFPAPLRVLVPFGDADITAKLPGFKEQTVVVQSSRVDLPADQRIRLERDEPDAPVTVRCPFGADLFIDGQMFGFEVARTKLLVGNHVVRCGKSRDAKAFERMIEVLRGKNSFDFSNVKE